MACFCAVCEVTVFFGIGLKLGVCFFSMGLFAAKLMDLFEFREQGTITIQNLIYKKI